MDIFKTCAAAQVGALAVMAGGDAAGLFVCVVGMVLPLLVVAWRMS